MRLDMGACAKANNKSAEVDNHTRKQITFADFDFKIRINFVCLKTKQR